MATGAGGGRAREPGELFNKKLKSTTSLDDAGYVLNVETESSEKVLDKCGSSEIPYAINYRSTRDPHDMNFPASDFKTGTEIGDMGIPVFREGWARLKLATDNAAIDVQDPIVCTGSGKVDKYTAAALDTTSAAAVASSVETRFNDLARIVGNAEEKVAAGDTDGPAQDKILVKLTIGANGIIT